MIAIVLILRGRTKYSNELLFDDLPATRFFEMTRDDIIAEYGEPDHTSFDEPDVYFDGGIFRAAYSESSGKVIYITFSAEHFTFNGTRLNKTADRALKAISSFWAAILWEGAN